MKVLKTHGFEDLFKLAFPVRFNPDELSSMKGDGIFVAPGETNKMPHVKDKKKAIQNLVGELALPRIIFADQRRIVELDGQQYYLVHVKPPQVRANPEGTLVLMNLTTGMPEEKPFIPYQNHLESIKVDRLNQSTEEINKKIRRWNERVSKLDNSSNPTTWPLQLEWAKSVIQDRLNELNSMMTNVETGDQYISQIPPSYQAAIRRLTVDLAQGRIPAEDAIDTAMFLYSESPTSFKKILDQLQVSTEAKTKILALIQMQESSKTESDRETTQKEQERSQRILDTTQDMSGKSVTEPVEEISPAGRKGGYPKSEEFFSWKSKQSQKRAKLLSMGAMRTRLQAVKESLEGMRIYIANLARGERSKDVLMQSEGRGSDIRTEITRFLKEAEGFFRSYNTDVFVKNTDSDAWKINPSLFSGEGSGNAEVALAVNHMVSIVQNSIRLYQEQASASTEPSA